MSGGAFVQYVRRIEGGSSLTSEEAARVFGMVMDGLAADPDIAAMLTKLAERKPTVDEIVGAAQAMRERMIEVDGIEGAIDLCGTGGDGLETLNISTACSFVVAGAGVPVAKHGNRGMSSKCGAADVLEALGARVDLDPVASTACLKGAGVCFLFAQTHHPALKYATPVRRKLAFRTIFNLLGPLTNPARVKRQLVGVYSSDVIEPVARALRRLGTESAWVVHGDDGMDEISITGATTVAILARGEITYEKILPENVGLKRAAVDAIRGGTPAENAAALKRLLDGEPGAYRDAVLINAGAALCVSGAEPSLEAGVESAVSSIDSGRARRALGAFLRYALP